MSIIVKVAVCGNESREFRCYDPKAEKPVYRLHRIKEHGNRGQALEHAKAIEEKNNDTLPQ